jgi:hypothetical protein
MYFTTFNHYEDTDIYNDDHDDICLICWEPSTTNNNIYKMKSLISSFFYYKSCTCNGSFHHPCLLKWIYKTHSCPICRIIIETNHDNALPLTFNIFKVFKYFYLSFFIIMLYNIIFNTLHSVEKKLQNNQNIQHELL